MSKELIQTKTLHSNHASLSDYYVPGSVSVAIPEVLAIFQAGETGLIVKGTIAKSTPDLIYNSPDGTYSVTGTSGLVYSDSDGTWVYSGTPIPESTPPTGNPTDPKLPTNPLPETQTETPAPVPIIVTNPEKVVEYVYVETPSAGAAIDNQDGTITVYI